MPAASAVQRQYEALPFPERNPEDEAKRLIPTGLDMLGKVSHFCFRGGLDLRRPLRVLVAGGGTGDATIFLAEQLRSYPDASVTHLDLSSASIDVARRRAEKRGLSNIKWVKGSILEIERGSLGEFDYINCAGVLHHLPDPPAGLGRLKSVLSPDGGMGLMVYGRYGRASVYEVQQLVKILGIAGEPVEMQLRHARSVLESLSPLHSNVRGWPAGSSTLAMDDANVFDTYLHSQDRAYSVGELYEFIEAHGLHIAGFGDFDLSQPIMRIEYEPATYIEDASLRDAVKRLPLRVRQAAAELLNGTMSLHSIYVSSRESPAAEFANRDLVPYCHDSKSLGMARALLNDSGISLRLRCDKVKHIALSPQARSFLAQVNGVRTSGEILGILQGEAPSEGRDAILAPLIPELERLNSINVLFLRDPSVPAYGFVTFDA